MWETCKAYLLYQNLTPKKHTSGCLQGSENLQDMILVLLWVQVQWDRTMRRVIMMEADVGDGSTPLLDTFDDIAEGQSKITIAQVKVCSGFSAASCWCTLYCSCRLPFCSYDQGQIDVHCSASCLTHCFQGSGWIPAADQLPHCALYDHLGEALRQHMCCECWGCQCFDLACRSR